MPGRGESGQASGPEGGGALLVGDRGVGLGAQLHGRMPGGPASPHGFHLRGRHLHGGGQGGIRYTHADVAPHLGGRRGLDLTPSVRQHPWWPLRQCDQHFLLRQHPRDPDDERRLRQVLPGHEKQLFSPPGPSSMWASVVLFADGRQGGRAGRQTAPAATSAELIKGLRVTPQHTPGRHGAAPRPSRPGSLIRSTAGSRRS